MIKIKAKRISWTPALIQAEADKYMIRFEWKKGSRKSYQAASRNYGGIDKYANHMVAQYIDWTPTLIQAHADKYTTRGEWAKYSPNSYAAAYRQYGIDKYAGHMVNQQINR